MGILSLLSLAIWGSSSAFNVSLDVVLDLGGGDDSLDLGALRDFVVQHVQPLFAMELPTTTFPPDQTTLPFMTTTRGRKPQDACKECVRHVTHAIMKRAFGKFKELCKKNHGCRLHRICEWAAWHPLVVAGMLVEHVRPLSLSLMFCSGRGVCKEEDTAEEDLSGDSWDVASSLMSLDDDAMQSTLDSIEKSDTSDGEPSKPSEACSSPPKDDHAHHGHHHRHHKHHRMEGCVKRASRGVMQHVVGKLVEMCHKVTTCHEPKCERMKRVCAWAKEHRPLALGMVIGNVQPWKFALGRCHRHHHRHHHHGGRHGHHDDHHLDDDELADAETWVDSEVQV